jgi:hypothetical protein
LTDPCELGHDESNRMRFTATIQEPGEKPEQIVCCRECAMALYQRDPEQLPDRAKNQELVTQLKRQLPDRTVEIPKPERVRETPSVERSIGLNPPGYGYDR